MRPSWCRPDEPVGPARQGTGDEADDPWRRAAAAAAHWLQPGLATRCAAATRTSPAAARRVTLHLPARFARRVGLALLAISAGARPCAPRRKPTPTAAHARRRTALRWPPRPGRAARRPRPPCCAAWRSPPTPCNDDAVFLAACGGAWLEVGDAKQAAAVAGAGAAARPRACCRAGRPCAGAGGPGRTRSARGTRARLARPDRRPARASGSA